MLHDAKEDLPAPTAFPHAHWSQNWSTNPLERTNKEIKRLTDVVEASPNPEAPIRMAGSVLIEQHNEGVGGATRIRDCMIRPLT